jgi:probable phosphoglycerate mutase
MSTHPKLTLLAIRHGETELNVAKRYQGHSDSPLTGNGRKQVSSLGRRMEKMKFDTLISSDLGRTQETAIIIAEYTGHSIKTDSRLRERNYGVLEGLTVSDIKAGHSEVLERLDANDPDYIIPDGESLRQHYQRNVAVFEELQSGISDGRVALVVHGGVLDSLFRYVARLPLDQPRCFITPNASLTIITHGIFYSTLRWVIETWGDTSHLEDISQHFGLG